MSGAQPLPDTPTLVLWSKGTAAHALPAQAATLFIACQLLGAVAGVWDAAGQFSGWGQWLAEAVATGGLILVVLCAPAHKAPALVACYIGAAYWFTASTSFANPAAVLGRMFSGSFAGIAPASALGFMAAEAVRQSGAKAKF